MGRPVSLLNPIPFHLYLIHSFSPPFLIDRLWFYLMEAPQQSIGKNVLVYGATILVGAGGATVLVTSLSMVADLIDNATVRDTCHDDVQSLTM